MTVDTLVIAAVITAVLGLVGVIYTRRGQDEVDSGKLALEIAKETRTQLVGLAAANNWLRGALTVALDHIDAVWQWHADGQPPPPPARRPVFSPVPPGVIV